MFLYVGLRKDREARLMIKYTFEKLEYFIRVPVFYFLFFLGLFLSSNEYSLSQEQSKVLDKGIPVNPDVSFNLNNKYGNIQISGWEKDFAEIMVRVNVKGVKSKEFIEKIDIKVHEDKSNVIIETIYPYDIMDPSLNISYNVNYVIKIPFNARPRIENEFGNIVSEMIRGDIVIRNRYGSVNVSKCTGKNDLSTNFNIIKADEIGANSKIENTNGSIIAENILGDLEIQNNFGEITVKNSKGNLIINNRNGAINVRDITGRLDLNNQFGNIKIENIGGILEVNTRNSQIDAKNIESGRITNSFGGIFVEDIRGRDGLTITNNNGRVVIHRSASNVFLRNSFDIIQLKDIDGRVDIYSSNSNIDLERIQNDVKIENSFGRIEIKSIGGDININNKNGEVQIKNIEKIAKTYNIMNEFGSIKIELPSNISAQFNADAIFGIINSDFPLQVQKSDNHTSVSGKINDGQSRIKLVTNNASIYIYKNGRSEIPNLGIPVNKPKEPDPGVPVNKPVKPNVGVSIKKPNNKDIIDIPDTRKIEYRIKKGDSIRSIAMKFHVKESDLKKWNNFPKRVGEKIIIFVEK